MLGIYENDLEFDDMVYILAVEDYAVFHDFMYEAYIGQTKG